MNQKQPNKEREQMKTMFFAMLSGIIFLIGGCSTVPYAKLSDEVSVKHVGWTTSHFVHYEANIKNTGNKPLSLDVVCDTDGGRLVYDVEIPPRHEEKITHRGFAPGRTVLETEMTCYYYKHNR